MKELIDVTHTVKASDAPYPNARFMFDPATGERYWVTDDPVEPEGPVEPESEENPYKDAPPPEVPPEVKPDPEVPPVPMPTPSKSKKAK